MTDDIESLIVKEAGRQGLKLNEAVVRQAAIDLAGGSLTAQGLIHLPGRGSISPADFTRSLRAQMPEGFSTLDDKPAIEPTANLTESMRREVAASRKQLLPSDWQSVRARYANGTTTAAMMDEAASRSQ